MSLYYNLATKATTLIVVVELAVLAAVTIVIVVEDV